MESIEDLYVKGLDLTLAQKYEEAIKVYDQILQTDPKYMDAYHSLSMTYMRLGNLDKAIEVEESALKINPDELMSHSNLSVFLQKKGLIQEAEAAKSKATILTWKQEAKERKQNSPEKGK